MPWLCILACKNAWLFCFEVSLVERMFVRPKSPVFLWLESLFRLFALSLNAGLARLSCVAYGCQAKINLYMLNKQIRNYRKGHYTDTRTCFSRNINCCFRRLMLLSRYASSLFFFEVVEVASVTCPFSHYVSLLWRSCFLCLVALTLRACLVRTILDDLPRKIRDFYGRILAFYLSTK